MQLQLIMLYFMKIILYYIACLIKKNKYIFQLNIYKFLLKNIYVYNRNTYYFHQIK